MRAQTVIAAALALLGAQVFPALAGGGARPQAHGAPMQQPQVQPRGQHVGHAHEPVQHGVRGTQGQAHTRLGGPRLEQRPDPNYQNPYRPMYSLDATNPGDQHPYFQTRKEGFGYPAAGPSPVYLGNGVYFIPR